MKTETSEDKSKNSLAKIRQSLKAPKSQKNEFGNYRYRSCEDILEAVKPLLGDFDLVIDDDVVLIGDRYYVKAKCELSDGEGKVLCTTTAFARESAEKKGMDSSQITGAASSYARKYALSGMFCIDDNKDADTQDNTIQHDKSTTTTPTPKTPFLSEPADDILSALNY